MCHVTFMIHIRLIYKFFHVNINKSDNNYNIVIFLIFLHSWPMWIKTLIVFIIKLVNQKVTLPLVENYTWYSNFLTRAKTNCSDGGQGQNGLLIAINYAYNRSILFIAFVFFPPSGLWSFPSSFLNQKEIP